LPIIGCFRLGDNYPDRGGTVIAPGFRSTVHVSVTCMFLSSNSCFVSFRLPATPRRKRSIPGQEDDIPNCCAVSPRYPSASSGRSAPRLPAACQQSLVPVALRSVALNDSMYPFSHRLPGSMNAIGTPRCSRISRTRDVVNSEPLSLRRHIGSPRRVNRSVKHSTTSSQRSRFPATIARHSHVHLSSTVNIRNFQPLASRPSTKS
jgi:hypothetical protein